MFTAAGWNLVDGGETWICAQDWRTLYPSVSEVPKGNEWRDSDTGMLFWGFCDKANSLALGAVAAAAAVLAASF